MVLNAQLKQILVWPKCKGDLEFHEEKNEIHCRPCALIYAIEDDIPVMLVDAARRLDEKTT